MLLPLRNLQGFLEHCVRDNQRQILEQENFLSFRKGFQALCQKLMTETNSFFFFSSYTYVLDLLNSLDLWVYSFYQILKIFWLLLFLIFFSTSLAPGLWGLQLIIHILCYLTLSKKIHQYAAEFGELFSLVHFG